MNYVNLLKHAARLFWNTKPLWVLGIVAAFFGQSEYRFSFNTSFSASDSSELPPGFTEFFEGEFFRSFIENPMPYVLGLFGIGMIWWVIATFFGWIAQGAMISMAAQADQGHAVSIGASVQHAGRFAGRLFLMHLLAALPNLIVSGVLVLVVIFMISSLFNSLINSEVPNPDLILPGMFAFLACFIPLVLIMSLLGIVLQVLNTISARVCVLEQRGVRASFSQGWRLIRKNAGYTALNWFILLILAGAFGTGAGLPTLVFLFPVGQSLLTEGWTSFTTFAMIGLGIYSIVMGLGVGGILTAFNSTMWTVLYTSFQQAAEPSPVAPPAVGGIPTLTSEQ
jgi:hypothetical protein